jgi:opacity protein-like surface antigen
MSTHKTFARLFSLGAILALSTAAPELRADGNWYLKPTVGAAFLSSSSFNQSGVAEPGATGTGDFDSGYFAGIGFGYRFDNGWSTDLTWEFRTNDLNEVSFSDGTRFTEGNYASNIFYLNGYYTFGTDQDRRWRPYLGAGLGYVQEIDIDLETGGVENSYSGDGELAYQVMGGIEYDLSDRWRLQGEARYVSVSGVDLDFEGAGTAAAITGIDYDGWTLGLNAVFDF